MKTGRTFFGTSLDPDNTEVVPYNQNTMYNTPCNVGPGSTVPQAAEQENDKGVEQHTCFSLTAASKGDVDVGDKKA